jgi:hypothetical protein
MAVTTPGSTNLKKPVANISKLEGVRQAMATLGDNAKPHQIQDFVRDNFGMVMTTGHISANKTNIRKQQGKMGTKPAAAKPIMRKPAGKIEAPYVAPTVKPAAPPAGHSEEILLEDVQTLKALVGRVGAASLKTLIDLLD